MDWNLEYGELSQDTDFVNNCENLKENLMDLQKVLDQLLPLKAHYDKMSIPSRIEYDLFLVYTLNSLYWIQLRLQGIDPTKHPIKDELQRIKTVMMKWQTVKDRELRPKINVEAAKRFVRSGLYDHNKPEENTKRKKFNEDI